jgi:hypothetical protein
MSDRGVHGKAVTCTECGAVIPVNLPDGADVPEFVFPAVRGGDLIHPDGSHCDMGVGA